MLRRLAFALSCLVLLGAAPARAGEPDYSDIWWAAGGAESGWGVNFAQSPGFIFATFFVYGADGKPVWVIAELGQIASGRYSGAVYRCNGTYYGSPWVPGNAGCASVGAAQFEAESITRGSLSYSVDGTNVVKTIERQSLTAIDLAGTYLGGMLLKNSAQCSSGASTTPYAYQLIVTEKANSVVEIDQITLDGATDCIMEGTTVQTGRVRTMASGTYKCEALGVDATVTITEMRRSSNGGIELAWVAPLGSGCTETGIFSGTPQQ